MAGTVKFFDTTDPFSLADWEIQTGPNPNRTKQRAQALTKDGDEFAHAQYGTADSGTFTYVAKKFTGFLAVPAVGTVTGGYHIDNWTVAYTQTGFPTLSINAHKHVDGAADANCRVYNPSFKVPARSIGVPSVIPAADDEADPIFELDSGAVVGMRGLSLALSVNHVDEMDASGGHLAGDNYDGTETLSAEFTGDVDPSTDYDLDSAWTDDSFSKSNGNTQATTTSLTATHHVAHYVATSP